MAADASPDDQRPRPALSLQALSLADAAKVLGKAGSRAVTEEMLQAHVAAGAPANADGTLNLVHYAAWLVREIAHGD
jgi:hypothetical protein